MKTDDRFTKKDDPHNLHFKNINLRNKKLLSYYCAYYN